MNITTLAVAALLAVPLAAQSPMASTLVANGFTRPTCVTHAPLDATRLFVAEKAGLVRIVRDGAILPTPFLDLTGRVNSSSVEFGLYALAFDPDYATNGWVYAHYTSGANADTHVGRFHVTANPDVADPSSHQTILHLLQSTPHHRGGWIGFGADGFLHMALGDGGPQEDPLNHAQDTTLLVGKILRVDVGGDDFPADPDRNYRVPASNPFAGQPGLAPEIWAYGLRNPWKCSFDRATSDLWVADVGEYEREEISFQPAGVGGLNYGWRCTEGTACTVWGGCTCNGPSLTPPLHDYAHNLGRSVTGGYVYRGSAIAGLQGAYVYGDYQSGRFWSFRRNGTGIAELLERTTELEAPGALAIERPVAFGEDAQGELYVCDYADGELYRIVAAPDLVAPTVTIQLPTADATWSTTSATIDLAGVASDDVGVAHVDWSNPDGAASGTATGTTSWSATAIPLAFGANAVTVTAFDGGGNPSTDVLVVTRFPAPFAYCAGDGTSTACPCGLSGAAERGCPNSIHLGGARLVATGFASLAADDLVLRGDDMPNSSVSYFQGTLATNGGAGSLFGDGLRCAGGSQIRLGSKVNVGGASRYPEGPDLPVSVRGGILFAPQTRTYQTWYRNAAAFCTPSTFNLSNGLSVTWSN